MTVHSQMFGLFDVVVRSTFAYMEIYSLNQAEPDRNPGGASMTLEPALYLQLQNNHAISVAELESALLLHRTGARCARLINP